MFALIFFEFKKIFKDVKNIICILFFILFIIGFVCVNSKIDANKKLNWRDTLYGKSNSISLKISELNAAKQKNSSNVSSKIDKEIDFLSKHQSLISNLITEYKNKNLKGYLNTEKNLYKHSIEGIKSNIDFNNTTPINEYKSNIEKIDILLEKNITPIFEDNCMEGYNFLRLCSSNIIMIVLILVLLNFVIDSFSSEFEKNTYKLLFIQPVSKSKILFSKFITRLIISIAILSLVIISFFLFLGLKNGFGNLEYPTKMYIDGKIVFVPLKQFLSTSLPLLLTVLLFLFCFSTLISCIFNSTSICISFTILISVTSLCLCAIIKPLKPFIPFSYIQINDLLCSNNLVLQNPSILSPNAFLFPNNLYYLIILSIFLIGCSLFTINKKVV